MGKPIICYDNGNNMWASRAAFVFKAWGFPEVYVLQGGLSAWTHGTEAGVNQGKDEELKSLSYNEQIVANLADIKQIIEDKSAQIVDARPSASFQGGNIPGSVSLPMPTLMDGNNLKPAEEVKAIFE